MTSVIFLLYDVLVCTIISTTGSSYNLTGLIIVIFSVYFPVLDLLNDPSKLWFHHTKRGHFWELLRLPASISMYFIFYIIFMRYFICIPSVRNSAKKVFECPTDLSGAFSQIQMTLWEACCILRRESLTLVSILPAICLNWGTWCASIEAYFRRKMERSYVGNIPWATQKMVSAMVINKSYSTRTKMQWWCFILLIMNRAFYSCVWWSIGCHP